MSDKMSDKTLIPEEGKLIGKIAHYFGNIGVGIIDLSDDLKIGDNIRIVGSEADFEQPVESMEIDLKQVKDAKSGQSVGLKVKEKVREGFKVYKL